MKAVVCFLPKRSTVDFDCVDDCVNSSLTASSAKIFAEKGEDLSREATCGLSLSNGSSTNLLMAVLAFKKAKVAPMSGLRHSFAKAKWHFLLVSSVDAMAIASAVCSNEMCSARCCRAMNSCVKRDSGIFCSDRVFSCSAAEVVESFFELKTSI